MNCYVKIIELNCFKIAVYCRLRQFTMIYVKIIELNCFKIAVYCRLKQFNSIIFTSKIKCMPKYSKKYLLAGRDLNPHFQLQRQMCYPLSHSDFMLISHKIFIFDYCAGLNFLKSQISLKLPFIAV